LQPEEKRVAADDNEVVDVRKYPQGRGLLSPEDTRVSNGRGETNGREEGIQTAVPGQRDLLEAIDSLNKSK
jgi:hypothetical protein